MTASLEPCGREDCRCCAFHGAEYLRVYGAIGAEIDRLKHAGGTVETRNIWRAEALQDVRKLMLGEPREV